MQVFLAFLSNVKCVAAIGGAVALVCWICFMIFHACSSEYDNETTISRRWEALKRGAWFVAALALVAAIPDLNDLWRVRIALIKLELASDENVKKGAEMIERVAEKLECKYLGCEEKKK